MRKLVFLLIMIFLGVLIYANEKISTDKIKVISNERINNMSREKEEILNIYRKFYQYKIDKNTKSLNEILDKNFTLTHMTGYKQPKDEWFEEIENEGMRYFSTVEEDISINVDGDNAELIGKNKVNARIHGYRNTWNLQLKMPMKKVNGKWIILEAIASSY